MTGIPKLPVGFNFWKVGAIVAMVAMLVLGAFAAKTQIERNQIEKEKTALFKQINDPITGYVARLTTAQNNVVVLKSGLARQNSEYTRQSNASKAEMNRLRQELRVAQAQTKVYQRRVNDLLKQPIKGSTPQERYDNVDNMVMEDLRK